MFNKILFPVDLSREARQAVDVVIEMSKKYHARLVILSVVESSEATSDRAAASDLLEKLKASFAEVGITAATRLEEGNPPFVICDVADDISADLIIMGSRGMSLAEEHPDDSVSQKVINLSPCPVLIVP